MLLEQLYKQIRDKSKIILNKRVNNVDHSEKEVTVHCTDGTSYQGDILAGADGVHSMVRHEMWRRAENAEPGRFSQKEMNSKLP